MDTSEKLVSWLYCLAFVFIPLVWLSNTSELFEFNKIIAVYVFTVLITVAWIARMLIHKKFLFTRSTLDIPLLVFLGSQFISFLFSSDHYTSWFGYYSRWNGGLLSLVCYSLLYWAFVTNVNRKQAMVTLKCLVIGTLPVALWAVLEHFGHSPSCLFVSGKFDVSCWVQDVQTRVFATIGQPNWLAAYITGLIFIPLSQVVQKLASQKHIVFSWGMVRDVSIFVLLFLTLLFTKSRSGLLAFTICSALYWFIVGFKLLKSHSKLVLGSLASYAVVCLALGLIIANPVRDLLIKSQADQTVSTQAGTQLEIGGTESGNIRKIVWTGAVRIWQSTFKNMLVGTGPETFAASYYRYRPVEHNATSEWELLYNKAHNEFLNYLATTGILGLGAYLLLLLSAVVVFIKTLTREWTDKSSTTWLMPTALLAGWLTIPITNFWGFSVVLVQLLMFTLPALAHKLSGEDLKQVKLPEVEKGQIIAIVVVCALGFWVLTQVGKYWLADTYYAQGQNANRSFAATQDSSYLILAYEKFTQAFSEFPKEANYASELGNSAAYLSLALKATNATTAGQLVTLAHQASAQAIDLSPNHPNFYKSYARTGIILSEIDPAFLKDAFQILQQAQSISPTDPRIPFNLGIMAQYLNATSSAKLYFEKALELKPDFADPKKALDELLP